jgi:hypothetical protein
MMQTDFITFGEAIRLVGFKKAAKMMRQALGIKTLAPWPSPPRKPSPSPAHAKEHTE